MSVWNPTYNISERCPAQCARISMDVRFDDNSTIDNHGNLINIANPCVIGDMAHNSFFFVLTLRSTG